VKSKTGGFSRTLPAPSPVFLIIISSLYDDAFDQTKQKAAEI